MLLLKVPCNLKIKDSKNYKRGTYNRNQRGHENLIIMNLNNSNFPSFDTTTELSTRLLFLLLTLLFSALVVKIYFVFEKQILCIENIKSKILQQKAPLD